MLLTSRLCWMGVGWVCREAVGAWGEFLMILGWCTETADNLVVGRFIGETNIGHSFFIIVGRLVVITWVVSNTCPTTCPSTEDSVLVAVDYRIVQGLTSLGRPIFGVVGLPGEGVWKSFDESWVDECPFDVFVYKTDRDDDGSCGPHNLREKMACRTMVGGWWGEGGSMGMVG